MALLRNSATRIPILILELASLIAFTVIAPIPLAAQEAPAPAAMTLSATSEPLTVVEGLALPRQGDLVVVHMSLATGAGFPIIPDDAMSGLMVVEAGTISIQVAAPITVTRAAAAKETFVMDQNMATGARPSARETLPMGRLAALDEGDAVALPAGVAGQIRNTGQETAHLLLVMVVPEMVYAPSPAPSPTPVFLESTTP